jgi:hydrogenase maturation protease
MADPRKLLVLGLGDASQGDDGLGAAAIALLTRAYVAPDGVQVAAAGTAPDAEGAHAALLLDVVHADAPPGAFIRLQGDEAAPALLRRMPGSAARWGSVILLGLVPHTVAPHAGLSPAVEAGLAGLVRHVVWEARQLGLEFRPRNDARPAVLGH